MCRTRNCGQGLPTYEANRAGCLVGCVAMQIRAKPRTAQVQWRHLTPSSNVWEWHHDTIMTPHSKRRGPHNGMDPLGKIVGDVADLSSRPGEALDWQGFSTLCVCPLAYSPPGCFTWRSYLKGGLNEWKEVFAPFCDPPLNASCIGHAIQNPE